MHALNASVGVRAANMGSRERRYVWTATHRRGRKSASGEVLLSLGQLARCADIRFQNAVLLAWAHVGRAGLGRKRWQRARESKLPVREFRGAPLTPPVEACD